MEKENWQPSSGSEIHGRILSQCSIWSDGKLPSFAGKPNKLVVNAFSEGMAAMHVAVTSCSFCMRQFPAKTSPTELPEASTQSKAAGISSIITCNFLSSLWTENTYEGSDLSLVKRINGYALQFLRSANGSDLNRSVRMNQAHKRLPYS